MSRGSSTAKYLVNARWRLGLGTKKIFFVFLVGKDQRTIRVVPDTEQRTKESLAKALIYTGIMTWFLLGFSILTFTTLYLVKSYSGIDLVKGSSPFPTFLKKIKVCH